jgi:alanyl-tRNA synthetase
MAQHTGQHIFSQSLLSAGKLETVSVHFGEETTTVEVLAAAVEERTLRLAEDRANAVVKENRVVRIHDVDPADASRYPLRRTPPDVGRLRVVEVDGFDWAACGGLHVSTTGEVFLVKVLSTEKIRGRVRIHVTMGRRALEDYGRKIALVQELSRALTCGEADIASRVEELAKSSREASAELRKLRVERAAADADASLAAATPLRGAALVARVFDAVGSDYLKAFADRVTGSPGRIVIAVDRAAGGFQWIIGHSLADAGLLEIVPPLLAIAEAKGGGRGARMQGAGRNPEAVPAFVDALRRELEKRLG